MLIKQTSLVYTGGNPDPALSPPTPQVVTVEPSGYMISIPFNKQITDPTGKEGLFTVSVEGAVNPVISAGVEESDSRLLILTLTNLVKYEQKVTVKYEQTEQSYIASIDGSKPDDFELDCVSLVPEPLLMTNASVVFGGYYIRLDFDKDLVDATGPPSESMDFSVAVSTGDLPSQLVDVTYIECNLQSFPRSIFLRLLPRIREGEELLIDYEGTAVISTDYNRLYGIQEAPCDNPVKDKPVLRDAYVYNEAQGDPLETKSFIVMYFSKDMQDPEMLLNSSFVPVADSLPLSVSTLERASINHKIFILEAGTEIESTDTVTMTHFPVGFASVNGEVLDAFSEVSVKNGSGTDSPTLTSAAVDEDGQHLVLTFSKGVTVGENEASHFTVKINETETNVVSASVSADDPTTLTLEIEDSIVGNDVVLLWYTYGDIFSIDNHILQNIDEYPVSNELGGGS